MVPAPFRVPCIWLAEASVRAPAGRFWGIPCGAVAPRCVFCVRRWLLVPASWPPHPHRRLLGSRETRGRRHAAPSTPVGASLRVEPAAGYARLGSRRRRSQRQSCARPDPRHPPLSRSSSTRSHQIRPTRHLGAPDPPSSQVATSAASPRRPGAPVLLPRKRRRLARLLIVHRQTPGSAGQGAGAQPRQSPRRPPRPAPSHPPPSSAPLRRPDPPSPSRPAAGRCRGPRKGPSRGCSAGSFPTAFGPMSGSRSGPRLGFAPGCGGKALARESIHPPQSQPSATPTALSAPRASLAVLNVAAQICRCATLGDAAPPWAPGEAMPFLCHVPLAASARVPETSSSAIAKGTFARASSRHNLRRKPVVHLLYTNNGIALLAVGSNAVPKLWKCQKSERNPYGKSTASIAPQLWQPANGILMTNDTNDSNPEEATACIALSKNDSYVMSASGGKVLLFNMMTLKNCMMRLRVLRQVMPPRRAGANGEAMLLPTELVIILLKWKSSGFMPTSTFWLEWQQGLSPEVVPHALNINHLRLSSRNPSTLRKPLSRKLQMAMLQQKRFMAATSMSSGSISGCFNITLCSICFISTDCSNGVIISLN